MFELKKLCTEHTVLKRRVLVITPWMGKVANTAMDKPHTLHGNLTGVDSAVPGGGQGIKYSS